MRKEDFFMLHLPEHQRICMFFPWNTQWEENVRNPNLLMKCVRACIFDIYLLN